MAVQYEVVKTRRVGVTRLKDGDATKTIQEILVVVGIVGDTKKVRKRDRIDVEYNTTDDTAAQDTAIAAAAASHKTTNYPDIP